MLSSAEFSSPSTDFIERTKERHAHSLTPTSMAPHAAGYFSTADKVLSMPAQGLTPIGAGALKGSFAFKNTAFD